jgi:hypothetical protein
MSRDLAYRNVTATTIVTTYIKPLWFGKFMMKAKVECNTYNSCWNRQRLTSISFGNNRTPDDDSV